MKTHDTNGIACFHDEFCVNKTSQRGFGRRSFEAAFSRNGNPSVHYERSDHPHNDGVYVSIPSLPSLVKPNSS